MIVLGLAGFTRDSRVAGGGRSAYARAGLGFDALFEWRDGEAPFNRFPLGYFGHDASAALVRDGEVVAAAAEERFTRTKHALNLAGNTLLPVRAARYCLEAAGLGLPDVDVVAHASDFGPPAVADRLERLRPFLAPGEEERLRASYDGVWEAMLSPAAVSRQILETLGGRPRRLRPVPHHLAHAASAFYPSGFREALVLTLDGAGERESGLLALGREGRIEPLRPTPLPSSLGTLYLVVTVHLGFRSLGDEYKVMGLAAYGDPGRYRGFFDGIVECGPGGACSTAALARADFPGRLLRDLGPPRGGAEEVGSRHADIAAALQEALARAVLHQLAHAREETGRRRLCLAGGVALNCALNGRIARSGLFDEIYVQPAAGDEGGSLGAALLVAAEAGDDAGRPLRTAALGPAFDDDRILAALRPHAGAIGWRRSPDIAADAAAEIERRGVVAWFQGRMEFGPRALGHRSIIADPRDGAMKGRLNSLVKHREPFRPFAPAVPEEAAADWFDMTGLGRSPFMLFTVPVREGRRARIPAVTHEDGTARVQTVKRETDPLLHRVLACFACSTGVPVLLNTSFNVNREPIVCTPEDAVRCFLGTGLDVLAIGDWLVRKGGTP